jgi:DNA-binding CsgD family transcriptional regulator
MAAQRIVLAGWCLSLSEDLPFLPFVDVLRMLLERDGRLFKSVLAACPGYVSGEIARLLPELDETREERQPVEGQEGWRRERLFGAVRALLVALGEAAPSALVIEDVHWADSSTRDLLDYLLLPSHWTGVPIVVTSRVELSDTGWLPDLVRRGRLTWLPLTPLTEAETAEQVELLGEAASPEFVEGVFTRAQGHPLFTEQLVSAGGGTALPATLNALLSERLSHATATGKDVVTALAIARRPLSETALGALTDRTASEIVDAVRDLTAHRLLQRVDGGDRQLQHVLLADAVCKDLTATESLEWHAKVAGHLAERGDAGLAGEAAEHFALAGMAEDELRMRVHAAGHAEALCAAAQAGQQWRQVIRLWDRVERAREVAGLDLIEAYFRAETAFENVPDNAAATAVIEEALQRFIASADDADKVHLYYRAGHWRLIATRPDGKDTLERAVELGAQLPPTRDYVRALHRLAQVHYHSRPDSLPLQIDLLTRAQRAAERGNFRSEQQLLAASLASRAMMDDRKDDALIGVQQAMDLAVDSPDPAIATSMGIYLTDTLLKYNELERVVAIGRGLLEDARRHGYPHHFNALVLLRNVSEALRELGRVGEALDELMRVSPVIIRETMPAYSERAAAWCALGRLDDALAFWNDNAGLVQGYIGSEYQREFALIRGDLLLWLGRPAEAFAAALPALEYAAATEDARLSGSLFVLAMRACADRAVHARANNDNAAVTAALHDANALTDLAARCLRDPFGDGGIPETKTAETLNWRAELCRVRNDNDPDRWDAAAQEWTRLQRPHRAGYARWRQAEALLATPKGRGAARDVLRTAGRQAETHQPLSRAIGELASRARIDLAQPSPTPTPPSPTSTPFGLTERELAVLALVGQGRTNSEIGAALFISAKTASVHVTNILRKLQVSSRVQAAAIAAQAGLLR